MVDKLIRLLTGASETLGTLDEKMKIEIERYNNKQIKKTAVLCYSLGIGTVLLVQWVF